MGKMNPFEVVFDFLLRRSKGRWLTCAQMAAFKKRKLYSLMFTQLFDVCGFASDPDVQSDAWRSRRTWRSMSLPCSFIIVDVVVGLDGELVSVSSVAALPPAGVSSTRACSSTKRTDPLHSLHTHPVHVPGVFPVCMPRVYTNLMTTFW